MTREELLKNIGVCYKTMSEIAKAEEGYKVSVYQRDEAQQKLEEAKKTIQKKQDKYKVNEDDVAIAYTLKTYPKSLMTASLVGAFLGVLLIIGIGSIFGPLGIVIGGWISIRKFIKIPFDTIKESERYATEYNNIKVYEKEIIDCENTRIESRETENLLRDGEGMKFTINFLPVAYLNLECIQALYSYIKNMRADTLKEALNLYESEKHNQVVMKLHEENRAILE